MTTVRTHAQLVLSEGSDLDALTRLLEHSESSSFQRKLVQTFTLTISSDSIISADIARLCEILERLLPSLKEINIKSSLHFINSRASSNYRLPIAALTTLFRHNTHPIEKYRINCIELTISEDENKLEELHCLKTALGECRSLKDFNLGSCNISERIMNGDEDVDDRENSSGFLDSILGGLSSVPLLEYVHLTSDPDFLMGDVSPTALGQFCQHAQSHLKSLTLRHVNIFNGHLTSMRPIFSADSSLRDLVLGYCHVSNEFDKCLAQFLGHNSCLTSVRLNVLGMESDDHGNNHDNNQNTGDRAERVIEALYGHDPPASASACLLETSKALELNRTMRSFEVFGSTTVATQEAFIETTRANYSLNHLYVEGLNDWQRYEISFHTTILNPVRRPLLEKDNASRDDWLDALVDQRNSLDIVFNLLSNYPTLCHFGCNVSGGES